MKNSAWQSSDGCIKVCTHFCCSHDQRARFIDLQQWYSTYPTKNETTRSHVCNRSQQLKKKKKSKELRHPSCAQALEVTTMWAPSSLCMYLLRACSSDMARCRGGCWMAENEIGQAMSCCSFLSALLRYCRSVGRQCRYLMRTGTCFLKIEP